jgi:hypothetical protein
MYPFLTPNLPEASEVPVHWIHVGGGIDNRVVLVLFPGVTAILAVHQALGLCVRSVRDAPVGRQVLNRSVEYQERAIFFALEVHWLPCTAEDTKTIVRTVACWRQSYGLVVTPAILVFPSDQVLTRGMAPRDVSPADAD